jgi:hypothetical protein
MDPVQSIYHFYDCFYRCVYPGVGGAINLIDMPYGDGYFAGEGCANPNCEPAYASDVCCSTTLPSFPNDCLYDTWFGPGIGGLSNWRRDKLHSECATRWFVEMVGHKGDVNAPLGGPQSVGSMYDTFVFLLHHERWWRIAEDCAPSVRIRVPGCVQGAGEPPSSDCGGIPFQEDDLVPKWWIFACSGVPIYQWEIDEALALGVISSGDYTQLMNAIALNQQPPQAVIKKFAAVYGQTRDWRADQRQAYIDLHAKFPNAGYDACIEDCATMPMLGPVRKRLTAPSVTDGVFTPLLRKSDVIPELLPKQAACFLDYDGKPGNESDYQFWRERQWVYFSAVPGGWTWAGWNANCDPTKSEVENILEGCSRGEGIGGPTLIGSPMLAFAGEPRPPSICVPCACVCRTDPEAGDVCCNDCVQDCATVCGPAPLQGCDPPSACRRFCVIPTCEGVRFIASQYYFSNDVDPILCVNTGEYRCLWTVESFLTTAQRSRNSWDAACPYRCRTENPPLPAFNNWPAVVACATGQDAICGDLIDPAHPLGYTVNDLCCGNYCVDYNYANPAGFPCPIIGPKKDCPAADDCPPHDTPAQVACIGHPIDCTEPPPP